jgi:hypothetical protein
MIKPNDIPQGDLDLWFLSIYWIFAHATDRYKDMISVDLVQDLGGKMPKPLNPRSPVWPIGDVMVAGITIEQAREIKEIHNDHLSKRASLDAQQEQELARIYEAHSIQKSKLREEEAAKIEAYLSTL